jgi:hypothetical protein
MKISLLFLFYPVVSFCQLSKADTSGYICVPKSEFTTLYTSVGQNCIGGEGLKVVRSPKFFIITDVKDCKSEFLEKQFLEVIYKGNPMVLESDEVLTKPGIVEEIQLMTEERKRNYKEKMISLDSAIRSINRQKLLNKLKFSEKEGLLILDWSLKDESEYTDGTGISFNVYNPTKKIIKYITFNVSAFNSVNDKVYSSKFKSYVVSPKGVGPIKPGESGEYKFDYLWFSDLPHTAKILSVMVQYMDGTSKLISNTDKVILERDLYLDFLGDTDD